MPCKWPSLLHSRFQGRQTTFLPMLPGGAVRGAFHLTKIPVWNFGNFTCPFRLHRPDPSHRAFSYWYCKQDAKERYWGQQFCQMERDIWDNLTVQSVSEDAFKVDQLQNWSRILRSDQTEMVRPIWCTHRNFLNFGLKRKRPKLQMVRLDVNRHID